MYLRFLSALGLVVFVLLSSNSVYANTLKGYDFPNDIYGFHHVWNSRDAAGCPTGQGGTAVMPNHAATGEALCDREAQRLGVNKAYMRWYMSPVFSTWSSPGDNKLCRYQGGKMQIVNGTTGGGKWTNVVVCKYEPFDCGDRWSSPLQVSGLNWQINWNRTKAPADYKRVGAYNFKCMPRTCTGATCPDTPANTRDECFLTDDPGEYRRLNGTLCACPASKEKVGNNCVVDQCANIAGVQATVPTTTTKSGANCLCKNSGTNPPTCTAPTVDQCNNITGVQTTVPTGTTKNAAGSCICNNGATNAPTCTTCPTGKTMVSGQCVIPPTNLPQCSDGIDNDGDGKIDYAVQTDSKGDTTLETLSSQGASTFVSILASKGITYDASKRREYQSWSIPGSTNVNIEFMDANLNHSSVLAYYDSANQLQGIFRTGSGAPSNDSQYAGLPLLNKGQNRTIPLQGSNIRFAEISHERTSSTDNSQNDSSKDRAIVYEVEPNDYIIGFEHGADSDYDDLIVRVKFPPADPDCTSATDNTESGDLTCPAGTTRKPTPASPICFLTVTPTTTPAGTTFSLTGYSHLTGSCTLASTTTHNTPTTPILPTAPSSTLSVSSTGALTINATTTGSFTTATTAQVASLLTCPHGTATCSIVTNGVISCGCYNPGITPPGTTIPAASFPATYDFKTNFPGVNYAITPRSGDRAFSRDIVGVINAHSSSLGLSDPSDTLSFYNTQATADQACSVLGYQTAEIYSDNKFDGTGGRKVAVYENNAWVIKSLSGNNDVINGLRCSGRTAGGTTTASTVTPPTYTCVSNTCDEGSYFCSAENMCKPAGQPCSAITCDKDTVCEVGESCNCSDCTTGVLTNDKDQCGLGLEGEQLYCTKDSVVASNTRFPFCLPACLDDQACTTTCNIQVGACCPAGSQWNSTEDSCVPTTCGSGQFYCAAQKKCLPGGTTCEPGTPVTCVNDGVCSGDESCQCADCVDGPTQTDPAKKADDKDKCSIIGGIQAMCSDDNLTDGKPGACCVPPEKWDSTANAGAGACRACNNTQAPGEIKANYDQPYITCTGNGNLTDTHFRYMIKQGTTVVMTSDIYQNSTQVLHPKISAAGTYTVQCFYGNATTVNTTGTATPHTCEKTMIVKTDNENAVQGCNRLYAYKGQTLSDEMTSNTTFDASFRCGARLTTVTPTNPFALNIGTIPPQFLNADATMTAFLAEYQIGAISTQTQAHTFNNGSVPVACAVQVGGGYSTNDYCRATACVGNNCNLPQAFSVVNSVDRVCTSAETGTYHIGCNPEAPDDIRTQCVEMFGAAVTAAGAGAINGGIFRLSFSFNGSLNTQVECQKYAANSPELYNIFDTVACKAILNNGEFYDIYAADSSGKQIQSLQTQARTVERDNNAPVLEPLKYYYTDSSLTTEVIAGKWSNKPVTAVAICRDAPTTESASCSCEKLVDDTTTQKDKWNPGVQHGDVNIGADLLRYTRTITESIPAGQTVRVVDTAGNKSILPAQTLQVNIDTDAPVMTITESATTATRNITLTATDSLSKIWKNTDAPTTTPVTTNNEGIIWRKGPRTNLGNLTFTEDCGVTPLFATVTETQTAGGGIRTNSTVAIPAVDTTAEVVTYCIRDNAGNTTRGIYPVVTDACFSATNMSPTIPTFATYRGITSARLLLAGTSNNQKYGYSFSENPTSAACFRGILATNIQTLVINQLEPRINTNVINWDDLAFVKNSTVKNTNGYYYYRVAKLDIMTSPAGTGTKSVVVDGGDIHIKENITYSGTGNSLLLIARRNSAGNGGNIIIDPTVTRIDAVLIADGGALQSSSASTPGERLTINGRIYSYNTRGGSLQPSGADVIDSTTPRIFSASGTLGTAPSLADAQKQDLERFRPSFVGNGSTCSLSLNYYAYTTATLPLLLQRPAGYTGGNCGF